MLTAGHSHTAICLALTREISRTQTVDEIYTIGLDALAAGLGVERASILLFDPDGVMRFKAYRGLSDTYRRAVEGHTPWTSDTPDPEPIVVSDVAGDPSLAPYLETIQAESIAAMAFIPLVSLGRVIGKFMLYFGTPRTLAAHELQLAGVIASQVAFALERTRAEAQARRSEARLRYALDAALMGTWDWDLSRQTVVWSDNLPRVHGLPASAFDGRFESYENAIHPDDRERVLASINRALEAGVPHEVEYRVIAPDGSVRWVEGKGHVEYEDGQPVRMTGVCMNVTRRKRAELARLGEAEEASHLKDEFLATLSHELRTPLNAILGWIQLLQSGELGAERTRHAVDVIDRNARLQAQLIEDILDVSRIITGKLEIEHAFVSVPQLIDTVVSGAAPAAQAKRIDVVKHVDEGLPPIPGDPKRLHQVLGNVLSNAIKFTPEGGHVDVCCRAREGRLEISVRDSGAGIAAAFLPHIFDRFRQADSRATRKHGGLGLGLTIARHLIERHGGEIVADSDGLGRGTTVVIKLPLATEECGAGACPPGTFSATVAEIRLDGATVVVVDDQCDSRELLGELFARCGASVVQCGGADAALAALARSKAQLLVADIGMPDVDGYELIRRLRTDGSDVAAIAVTAYARPEDRVKAMASGYNGYCAKPIDASAFMQTVCDVIRFA